MKRKQISIAEQQEQKLKDLAKTTGLSESEIVRRALDRYFEQKKEKK